jgi:hypothetical protein
MESYLYSRAANLPLNKLNGQGSSARRKTKYNDFYNEESTSKVVEPSSTYLPDFFEIAS